MSGQSELNETPLTQNSNILGPQKGETPLRAGLSSKYRGTTIVGKPLRQRGQRIPYLGSAWIPFAFRLSSPPP